MPPPSCVGLAKTCGVGGSLDCCAANLVTGATFNRGNDAKYPATVSDFLLDDYEITVGRFRKFVAAYSQGMIAQGAGKNPNNAADMGWDVSMNASLDANAAALKTALQCAPGYATWTDALVSAAADSLPINCVDWFEAQAFCIWDGGRLPTEAEWNYAQAGGTAQRQYPWGSAAPDCNHVNYWDLGLVSFCYSPPNGGVNRVGSESTTGDSLFGQADMSGNVAEWIQDWWANSNTYTNPCDNCAYLTPTLYRVHRGGSFYDGAALMATTNRNGDYPTERDDGVGIRCARTP